MAINFETFINGGFSYALTKLKGRLDAMLALKYDKTGGDISGDVKIFGNLTLDIEDEDYDAGIRFQKSLDNNAGTVITLVGYANGEESTNYKPVIRNISNPVADYDVANKRYVDAQVVHPDSYLVFLNNDGTIDTYSSNLKYSKVKSELTSYTTDVYLDVIYGTSRVHIPAMQDMDTNAGPVVFMGAIRMLNGDVTDAVFLLDSNDTLTAHYTSRENAQLKTNDIITNAASAVHYPSTKAVYDQFERKPDIVWEVQDVTQGLLALNANITANLAWQLTNLDLTPYSRIKIFAKAGRKTGSTAADSSITPAVILEMSLDDRAKETVSQNVFIGSILFQNPNDANRLGALTCAVSADKTKFAVTRATSLYGTAATSNTDTYQYVFKIEGFYD